MGKIIACFLLGIALAFTLSFSYLMKRPCLEQPWGGSRLLQYRNACYNDIQALYVVRRLNERAFPYVVVKNYEYPVLVGMTMWTASLFARSDREFFRVTAIFLSLMAGISLLAMVATIGPRRRLLWFAAGTPLLFYAFYNWDLLPVACVCLAIWAWSRGKLSWTGALLGLGVAAKIYPGFLLPPLVVSAWRTGPPQSRRRNVIRLIGSAIASWTLVNLPIVVAELWRDHSLAGWWGMFAFHAGRGPDFCTTWYWLGRLMSGDHLAYLSLLPPLVVGWITIWQAMRTRVGAPEFSLVIAGALVTAILMIVMGSEAIREGAASDAYRILVDRASLSILGIGALGLLMLQWYRGTDPWTVAGGILSLYLCVSKVHSPQYALWILPLMVVTTTPTRILLGYFFADLLVFICGFSWGATPPGALHETMQALFIAGIFLRTFFLGWYVCRSAIRSKDLFRRPAPLLLIQLDAQTELSDAA